jgi:hypothetical protein
MKSPRRSLLVIRLIALALGCAAICVALTQPQASELHHTVVSGDAITWGPAPPSLPPGAQAAILLGSPAKEGPFVLRLKFPAGFAVPPHRHSKDEYVTVIAGAFAVASGEKIDRASAKPLPHAVVDVETIVQINGVGPFDVTYVDPKDDPRKR